MTESIKKPKCRLVGTDGNVYSIIANVSQALKKAGQPERAREFRERAMQQGSYDDVLALLFNYVDPS